WQAAAAASAGRDSRRTLVRHVDGRTVRVIQPLPCHIADAVQRIPTAVTGCLYTPATPPAQVIGDGTPRNDWQAPPSAGSARLANCGRSVNVIWAALSVRFPSLDPVWGATTTSARPRHLPRPTGRCR